LDDRVIHENNAAAIERSKHESVYQANLPSRLVLRSRSAFADFPSLNWRELGPMNSANRSVLQRRFAERKKGGLILREHCKGFRR